MKPKKIGKLVLNKHTITNLSMKRARGGGTETISETPCVCVSWASEGCYTDCVGCRTFECIETATAFPTDTCGN